MDEKEFSNMNVIPLVDVMLVLLTIVLTTSTFIATGAIPVELPKAESGAPALQGKIIDIDSKGNLFLESKPVTLPVLQEELIPLPRSLPILIRADRNIALQHFVDVMDMVKGLGFTKMSLQTEKEK